ncbi:MFS transporter [Nocardia sp. NPDC056064]|uniref:MFS transporter n=1 Tax=Nocardia sp. NPDC056064 TaxID=3345701 RepID=UPI0035E02D95
MNRQAGFRPPDWAVLSLLCLGQLIVVLDLSIVNVALPAIKESLGFSEAGLQWVVNGYAITFAGFLLLGGRVADLIGRRRVFVLGLAIFTVASLAGGLATSPEWLIIARVAQGFGGALLSPATLAILSTTFTEPKAKARATAAWGAISGAGAALGSVLGGVLTDIASWEWIFYVNIPLGLLALAFAFPLLRESRAEQTKQLDAVGAVLVTTALIALVFGAVDSQNNGWAAPTTWGPILAAAVLLVWFTLHESRVASAPLIPLYVLKIRSIAYSNTVMFWIGAAVIAHFYFLSLYMQNILGYDALQTGLAFLPGAVAMTIGAYSGPPLVKKFGGVRPLLTAAPTLSALGLLLLAFVPDDGSYLVHLLIPQVLITLGAGLLMVPLVIAATSGVAPAEAGLASGIINTTRQFGGAIGLAVLATIAASATSARTGDRAASTGDLLAGYHAAFGVGAVFAVVALAFTFGLSTAPPPAAPGSATPAPAKQAESEPEAVPAE